MLVYVMLRRNGLCPLEIGVSQSPNSIFILRRDYKGLWLCDIIRLKNQVLTQNLLQSPTSLFFPNLYAYGTFYQDDDSPFQILENVFHLVLQFHATFEPYISIRHVKPFTFCANWLKDLHKFGFLPLMRIKALKSSPFQFRLVEMPSPRGVMSEI